MNEILNLDINDMPECEFDCGCGKHHKFDVHGMAIGKNAITSLPEMAKDFKHDQILLVADNNTYKAAGKKASEILKSAGFDKVKELVFECGENILIPHEETVGRILLEQDPDCKLMIAVGGGVINDSVKYVTARTNLPYIVIASAPSMDGYVSDSAALFKQGHKITLPAHLTYGLIGDTEILKSAPEELIKSGYGDVVGKITALTDWDLAMKANGDFRCDTCVKLVQNALDKCISKAEGLKTGDEDSLAALLEALTLTGVAMSLINITRPASGAEHLLSHYWEMDYISRGLNPIHHGIQVGVATPVICRVFEEIQDDLPEGVMDWCMSYEEVEDILRKGGAPVYPADIGISKELFRESVANAYKVRPRYSVLQYAHEKGLLEDVADKITNDLYN